MTDRRHPWQAFEVGLVTIELETAFLVSAAEGDNLFDAVFVTDANGLPCIPGESLAGVLRHALAGTQDPEKDERCRQVFGYQDRDEGASARVRISFAQTHGQDDLPVPFRGAPPDDVLAFLQAGVGRDHVRIGMHGAVDGRGKFDELIVPAGARFTFEMSVARDSQQSLVDLVGLLSRPEVRIGRGTRRGLGRLRVVKVRSADFDLSRPADLKRLSQLPVAIERAVKSPVLPQWDQLPAAGVAGGDGWIHGTLSLRPIGTWMVGGGIPTGREPGDRSWERVPLTERRITWPRERGQVVKEEEAPFLVPASAVKGALRHRTAFHSRRLEQRWLDPAVPGPHPVPTEAETILFGEVRDQDRGHPGRVHLSDVYLSSAVPYQPLQHVSLDRFTQGPMDHLLYDEVALGDCELKLDISVRRGGVPELACRALAAALDDLRAGRLAIGAGRGHGRFRGGDVLWAGGQSLIEEATCRT